MSCSKEVKYKQKYENENFCRKCKDLANSFAIHSHTLIKIIEKICKARDHASRRTKSFFFPKNSKLLISWVHFFTYIWQLSYKGLEVTFYTGKCKYNNCILLNTCQKAVSRKWNYIKYSVQLNTCSLSLFKELRTNSLTKHL